ncbi:DUF4198 domain-containing protein [Rhodobacteraceae bacterium]|nr:DUF4198 domain-containing protein [Paracoccaceae bacterium]
MALIPRNKCIPAVVSLALISVISAAVPSQAHEFWIDPLSGHLDPGDTILAHLRVGENLSGAAYPYVSKTVAEMKHWVPGGVVPISAREGDRPAINTVAEQPGLHRITVQSHPAYIVFDDMPEFEDYLQYEGLGNIADLHRERGLPGVEIAEGYIRNGKSLLQVGNDLSVTDQRTDLPFELTVIGNPFDPKHQTIDVELTWNGAPVPGTQVSVFYLPSGGTAPDDSERRIFHTNDDGLFSIALSGAGAYLLNAVRMSPVDGPGTVVWESYWASLTFSIPK